MLSETDLVLTPLATNTVFDSHVAVSLALALMKFKFFQHFVIPTDSTGFVNFLNCLISLLCFTLRAPPTGADLRKKKATALYILTNPGFQFHSVQVLFNTTRFFKVQVLVTANVVNSYKNARYSFKGEIHD